MNQYAEFHSNRTGVPFPPFGSPSFFLYYKFYFSLSRYADAIDIFFKFCWAIDIPSKSSVLPVTPKKSLEGGI